MVVLDQIYQRGWDVDGVFFWGKEQKTEAKNKTNREQGRALSQQMKSVIMAEGKFIVKVNLLR